MMKTPELDRAIEQVYERFQSYRRWSDTEPCLCCHTREQELRLHSKPLEKLTAADLTGYAQSALYTWGNEHDFKHFLPRLLELLVTLDHPGELIDPQALFRKLPDASWWLWPAVEREALSGFLKAMWRAAINTEPEELDWEGAAQWLCALAGCEDDLLPYLHLWGDEPSVPAHRNLAKLILESGLFQAVRVPWGYWEGRQAQLEQLNDWLKSPAVFKKLESAIERWPDAPFADELLEAAVFLKP